MNQIRPSVILCSEARLTSSIDDAEVNIDNYTIYRSDSHSRHTGGAVIYVRNDINTKCVKKISFNKNFWIVSLCINTPNWRGIIACLYHSPDSNDNDFIDEFIIWCSEIIERHDNIFICGDFNINWYEDDAIRRKLHQGTNDMGLSQIINSPTRITNTSKT